MSKDACTPLANIFLFSSLASSWAFSLAMISERWHNRQSSNGPSSVIGPQHVNSPPHSSHRCAFTLAFSRPVGDVELKLANQYLAGASHDTEKDKNTMDRWERYAQVLLGSNEFMYLD